MNGLPIPPKPASPPPRPGTVDAANAVAWRVYEVCVCKGYVDGRDWFEADAELRAESRRAIREATAPNTD